MRFPALFLCWWVLSIASSLLLTAIYLVFCDAIIAMFGGTVNMETFDYSREYFFYITLGIPFYMFGQAMNPVIRADGSPKFAMISTLAGAVINNMLRKYGAMELKPLDDTLEIAAHAYMKKRLTEK